MFAIVSLLDSSTSGTIQRLWKELEAGCGLTGVRVTPYPHFSWHAADGYDDHVMEQWLKLEAEKSQPFTVRTSGLGVFTGISPVVYIPIVKNPMMMEIQKKIWIWAGKNSSQPNPHFSPEIWIPHITLAFKDLNPEKLSCALEKFFDRDFNWEIRVDNYAIVCQEENRVGEMVKLYDFNEE
jgi:2'-5' RNA ligase